MKTVSNLKAKASKIQKLIVAALMSTLLISSMQSPASAQLASGPNDPLFTSGNQWSLGIYGVPAALRLASGRGITVAILANGVDSTHPDLSGKVRPVGRISSLPVGPDGTNMALLVAGRANNGVGGTGIAPDAEIISVNTRNSNGVRDVDALVEGIQLASQNGARIIVLDFERLFRNEFGFSDLQRVNDALRDFHDNHNGLVFMPSGDNGTRDNQQQRFPHIIVVSGFDRTLNLRPSNTGAAIVLAANKTGPGWANSGPNPNSTKHAAAEAAGIAALLWSYNTAMSNSQVENLIITNCSRASAAAWEPNYGFGIPNVNNAIRNAPNPQLIRAHQNRTIQSLRFEPFPTIRR